MDVLLSIRSAILYLLLGILISYKPSYMCMRVCVCPFIAIYIMFVCVCACVFISGYIHICVCVILCICISVFVCVLGPPGIFESAQSLSLSIPLSLIYSVVCWAQSCVKRAFGDFSQKNTVLFRQVFSYVYIIEKSEIKNVKKVTLTNCRHVSLCWLKISDKIRQHHMIKIS